jgi:hypothetical protein
VLSEEHLKWLPETYFPVVGQGDRFPRYKNKRSLDIYALSFIDENGIDMNNPTYGLPNPNQLAAYMSMYKYAKDLMPMTEKEVQAMNLAWKWTIQHFWPYMGGARVKTVEEVVPDLDKDTSSGYPFNQHYPKKKDLFEKCPEIIDWLNKDWDALLEDKYTFCFTTSLKEEIRPEVKTKQNKIRTFTAGAVDGTVHGNRLFADMNERMNSSYLRSSSGVGMSPLKGNWDHLYRKLNIFRKGYALDESEYDSSLRCYMMWGCARLRWEMLREEDQTPENLKRLKVYYRNLVNSLVMTPEGVFVLKLGGNPSGSCNTINDNTLILYTLLAYAWIMNCGDEPKYFEFEANTAKVLVGDDNTWTVSDWAHGFFNAKTVIETWNKIGITTTTDSMEPREAKDLDFLSAKTIFYCGRAIPVYDREKLMTSLLYAETKKQSPAFTLLRAAALLSVGWSDTQFRKFCRDFILWLLEHFDEICCDDVDWIQAKCGILSDERLAALFLGEEVLYQQSFDPKDLNVWNEMRQPLEPDIDDFFFQCYGQHLFTCTCREPWKPWYKPCAICQEALERLEKPDKTMSVVITPKKNSNRGKRGGKKGGKKPQATRIIVQAAPKKGKRARNRGKGRSNNLNVGRAGFIGPRPNSMNPTFQRRQQSMLTAKGSSRNRTTNRHEMVLEEDEYIGEVTGASTAANFQTTAYPVNIGQSATFPWGSGVVKNNFEKYQFDYIRFYYKRESSEFATAATTGKVMLSFDSDASDPPPSSKQQVEDTDPHADGMPCENIQLDIPAQMLRRMNDGFYIRPAGLPGANDIKTYDVGNLYVSTQGLGANSATVGELHVRYRVRVFFPILENQAGAPANNSVAFFQTTTTEPITTATPTILLLATSTTNGLGVVNTAGSLALPVGNYLVDCGVVVNDSMQETQTLIRLNPSFNGISLIQGTYPPQFSETMGDIAANEKSTLTWSGYVSCGSLTNNALTLPVTYTAAAGTLTMCGWCRIVAI